VDRVVKVLRGSAVWYGAAWHGKKTASGERFNRHDLTAAHRSLPLGSRVRVTNVDSGRAVVVRINDRGPYGPDRRRIIDVSEAAARRLGFARRGSARVKLEVLERIDPATGLRLGAFWPLPPRLVHPRPRMGAFWPLPPRLDPRGPRMGAFWPLPPRLDPPRPRTGPFWLVPPLPAAEPAPTR
jgi:rare lipoprotein A